MTERSVEPLQRILVSEQETLDALQGHIPEGVEVALWAPGEQLPLKDPQAVILPYGFSLDPYTDLEEQIPSVRLIQTQSTGYDAALDLVGDDVAICSAAGVHAAATAEMAVGLALASLRGIARAAVEIPQGQWNQRNDWRSLADRKVLLIGYGGIGHAIYRRLEPFELSITRVASTSRDDELGHIHGTDELLTLAGDHDLVIVIVPLSDDTRHLISEEFLAALPDGALVVNMARGAVVDSAALTSEVLSGRLSAALDVFDPEPMPADHPLRKAPQALITPHIGGSSTAFPPRIRSFLRKQVALWAAGALPQNVVRPGTVYPE